MKLHDVAEATARFSSSFEPLYQNLNASNPDSYPVDLPVSFWIYIYAKLLESWILNQQSIGGE